MAYTIKLGSFSKLKNSTAQPDLTGWAEYDITLKGGADLSAPVVTLRAELPDVIGKNYAVLFDRYYYITGRFMDRAGFVTLTLRSDPMATFKTEIGNTNMYILRAANAYNGNIMDSLYPVTTARTISNIELDDYPSASFSGGVYVITVAGTNTAGSTLYQLSPANFRNLISSLLSTINGFVDADVISAIHNSLFQPMDYINSVMWFPEGFATSGNEDIYIGKWNSGVTGGIISNTIKNLYYKTITLPKHPQAASRGNYLNLMPFSRYELQFEPFGLINLDTTLISGASAIDISVYIEALTGMATLTVGNPANTGVAPLASISAQIGTPVQITSHGANLAAIGSTAANIGGAIGSSIIGNYIGAAAMGVAAIESATGSIAGITSTYGTNGGILGQYLPKRLTATFLNTASEDNTSNGRPLCENRTPASLGGFMIAEKGEVKINNAPLSEQDEINAYMESGFYYE